MKIIAISDIHGNYKIVEKIPKYDILVIAGDLTDFENPDIVDKILERVKKPVLAVPGNWDSIEVLKKLEKHDVSIYGRGRVINGIGFFGCGGANGFIGDLGFTEDEIKETLITGFHELPRDIPKVLVSHAPPFGYCDRIITGVHVGSSAVADFIGKVDVIISGHIHEARGIEITSGTTIINCGFGQIGQYVEIEYKNGKFNASLKNL
ncbi:MAG: metallophosphoesterase family protein [Candidatus Aenigmarchaeota archaeon]|nr:metallophosphoesterase family protein [Candidatus Aenigmarchaeota archaeon]